MLAKRILVTGHTTSHLVRYVQYACELGATVLQMGFAPAITSGPPVSYRYEPVNDVIFALFNEAKEADAAEREVIRLEITRLAALAAEFAPDVYHSVGADGLLQHLGRAHLAPLLVSALGYLEHWVYRAPKLKTRDEILLTCAGLLVEPPMMVEIAKQLLPATVRVEELSIGIEGQYFHPVDAATRAAWRRALNVPPDATLILSPRGLAPGYGHEYVLDAFAKVLPHLPTSAYLFFTQMARRADMTVVDRYFQQIRQQADTLGITDQVRWLPNFPTVGMATLYNAADLVVSYRNPDTFPVTVLEVMACARPVIVSNVATVANSVIAQHCRLVPPEDSDALAAAMLDGVLNPPDADALATAREAVLTRYDKPVVMQKLATIYDALMTPSSMTPSSMALSPASMTEIVKEE